MRGKQLIISILISIVTGVIANFIWAWLTPIAPLPHPTTPAPYHTAEPATPRATQTSQRSPDLTAPSENNLTLADIRDELFPRQLHPVLLTLLLLLRAVGVICLSVIAFLHLHCMGNENPPLAYQVPCHLVAIGVGAFTPEILLTIVAVTLPFVMGAHLLHFLLELPAKLRNAIRALNTRKTTLPKQPGPHFAN